MRVSSLAGLALPISAAFLLAACEPAIEEDQSVNERQTIPEDGITQISSTGVMDDMQTPGVNALGFLPDANTPWAGLIVSAQDDGGLQLYNTDGQNVGGTRGPVLHGLAIAPGFSLRGQALPLIFAADREAGRVVPYAMIRTGPDIIEIPVMPIEPDGGISWICAIGEGIGTFDFVVIGQDPRAEIWRISDDGGELISAEMINSFQLSATARFCDVLGDELFVAGAGSGIARYTLDGAELDDTSASARQIVVEEFLGRAIVLTADGGSETLQALDARNFSHITDIDIVDGFSIPGVAEPDIIAASSASFGGASFQSGLIAVTDASDGRIRIIAFETMARELALAD